MSSASMCVETCLSTWLANCLGGASRSFMAIQAECSKGSATAQANPQVLGHRALGEAAVHPGPLKLVARDGGRVGGPGRPQAPRRAQDELRVRHRLRGKPHGPDQG